MSQMFVVQIGVPHDIFQLLYNHLVNFRHGPLKSSGSFMWTPLSKIGPSGRWCFYGFHLSRLLAMSIRKDVVRWPKVLNPTIPPKFHVTSLWPLQPPKLLVGFLTHWNGDPSDVVSGKNANCIGTRQSALHSTVHFWRIASFLMLSTSKIEEVSQK